MGKTAAKKFNRFPRVGRCSCSSIPRDEGAFHFFVSQQLWLINMREVLKAQRLALIVVILML